VFTTPTALVRRPGPRLADGIVTHIERVPVDLTLAQRQHDAYVAVLAGAGYGVREVEPADDCPDAVFIEDTVVMLESVAVLTRPGAPERRPELAGTANAVETLGMATERIEEPGTLDGGDVLIVDRTIYVGRSGRTNADGIRQLRDIARRHGYRLVAVPVWRVLHLKSAITALPDGTFVTWSDLVDAGPFGRVRVVDEEAGAHVVVLNDTDVLLAASAPRTAALIADLGFHAITVDISEFEKLEGCVTCLSVLAGG
jgi:dimethylargininase